MGRNSFETEIAPLGGSWQWRPYIWYLWVYTLKIKAWKARSLKQILIGRHLMNMFTSLILSPEFLWTFDSVLWNNTNFKNMHVICKIMLFLHKQISTKNWYQTKIVILGGSMLHTIGTHVPMLWAERTPENKGAFDECLPRKLVNTDVIPDLAKESLPLSTPELEEQVKEVFLP